MWHSQVLCILKCIMLYSHVNETHKLSNLHHNVFPPYVCADDTAPAPAVKCDGMPRWRLTLVWVPQFHSTPLPLPRYWGSLKWHQYSTKFTFFILAALKSLGHDEWKKIPKWDPSKIIIFLIFDTWTSYHTFLIRIFNIRCWVLVEKPRLRDSDSLTLETIASWQSFII